MNYSVWAAQGSKGKNQFKYFSATFEGDFQTFNEQNKLKVA